MSGTRATKIDALGSPVLSVVIACSSCARNVAAGVTAGSVDVHASFAPCSTVTTCDRPSSTSRRAG
jgi:hypothetical protein